MLTHIPFQSWCATCVAARGKQQWRRRRKPKIQDTESDKSGIPLTEIDYIFVGSMDGQGVATILAAVAVDTGYGFAELATCKGGSDLGAIATLKSLVLRGRPGWSASFAFRW